MKHLFAFVLLYWANHGLCQNSNFELILAKVDSLNTLAESLGNAGKIEEGLAAAKLAGDLTIKELGLEHEKYAANLGIIGVLHYQAGRYGDAMPIFQQAKDLYEKTLGKFSVGYATNADNLGEMYRLAGRYEEAEPLFLEAMQIRRKILGEQHFDFAVSQNNLANLYSNTARYEEAEPLFVNSKELLVKLLGEDNINAAMIIGNLATFYENLGRYEEAEPLFTKSNSLLEKLLGEHQVFAMSLNNLAALYARTGRFQQAEQLYLKAIAMREKTLGKNHIEYFQGLNNLAELYRDAKMNDNAEILFLKAIGLAKESNITNHPDYAVALNNIANLYEATERLEEAEKYYKEAIEICKETVGTSHPNYAVSLNNLANFYKNSNRPDIAEPLCKEAVTLIENALGKEHHHYIISLINLASINKILNRNDLAEAQYLEANAIQRKMLANATRYMSENELSAYTDVFVADLNNLFSLLQSNANGASANLLAAVFDNALFYKGFLLSETNKIRRLAANDTTYSKQYNLYLACHRRLATEYSKTIAARQNIEPLEIQANQLEKSLVSAIAGLGKSLAQVDWMEVQKNLIPGEIAIEFIHYKTNLHATAENTMYCAVILKREYATPLFVPLFEARQLEVLLSGNSDRTIEEDISNLYDYKLGNGKKLYELIWKPLERHLKGVKTIYCSPTGLLHKINLGAIPLNETTAFLGTYQLVTLGSSRQLAIPNPTLTNTKNPSALVIGGVRYDPDINSSVISVNSNVATTRMVSFNADTTLRGGNWGYLPNTLLEAIEINKILKNVKYTTSLDTGYFANEAVFKQIVANATSPRIIHISTHGYFFPDLAIIKEGDPAFKSSRQPMIRSGLILAGAQQAWSGSKVPENQEDGILTAYEISQMNLDNTELVVLSACETGLGDIKGNEGVYGLQRAFKIAGARNLIMSLWNVNDKSSRLFMEEFYKNWLTNGMTIRAAFRATQLAMKKRYPDDAFNWAGFVLVE